MRIFFTMEETWPGSWFQLNNSESLNSSTTVKEFEPESKDSQSAFYLWFGVFIPGITCILGIIGNIVSFIVLSCDKGDYPTFFTLKSLAVSDIVLLTAALWQQVIPLFCKLLSLNLGFCRYMVYVRIYTWPFILIAQMNSIWLTVIISTERYFAICRPLQALSIQNKFNNRLYVGILTVISILYNIPRFFEFIPKTHTSNNITTFYIMDTSLRRNIAYRYVYNITLHCLVIFVVPLVSLTFLNVRLIIKVREAVKNWSKLNRSQYRQLRATAIPLCIVIVFGFCGAHSFVTFLLDAIFVHKYYFWLQEYTTIANLFVILNSAVNFIIFYMFGSKFRCLFKSVVRRRLSIISTATESLSFRRGSRKYSTVSFGSETVFRKRSSRQFSNSTSPRRYSTNPNGLDSEQILETRTDV